MKVVSYVMKIDAYARKSRATVWLNVKMVVMSRLIVVQRFHVQPINSNVNIPNNVSRVVSSVMEMQIAVVCPH